MRSPFWLKLTVALLTAAFLYQTVGSSPAIQDLVLGCKLLAVEKSGSAAQRERIIDDAGQAAAARNGTMQDYETTIAFRDAVESQRRLSAKNPQLAAAALEIALSERDESQNK